MTEEEKVTMRGYWTTEAGQHGIPEHMVEGVVAYIVDHQKPGGFLGDLLSGRWPRAIAHADKDNQEALAQWGKFLFFSVPAVAYGSAEKVKDWLEQSEESS